MVRANTAKLADVLSGKVNLTHALGSAGVSVGHGVTCASTWGASYTVQYNGVCNAVACDDSTTLALQNGKYICKSKPEDGSSGSNVGLYVGIGVGVLVGIVAGVAMACYYYRTKQSRTPTERTALMTTPPENPLKSCHFFEPME